MDSTYKLIKYLTDGLEESQYYFVVPSLANPSTLYEVMWIKGETLPWRFREKTNEDWTCCSQLDLLDALVEHLVDVDEFDTQLRGKILTTVAYMNMRIKKARKLVGDDFIDAGLKAFSDFGKELVSTIESILGKKNKPKLTIVKD